MGQCGDDARTARTLAVARAVHCPALLSANARLQAAYPMLSQLAQETHETASWVERDGDDIVVLGNIPSEHLASVNLPVGSRFAALPASSGQMLLSQEPEGVLREMLGRLSPEVRARFGDRDDDDIIALIEKAGSQGWSMTEKNCYFKDEVLRPCVSAGP